MKFGLIGMAVIVLGCIVLYQPIIIYLSKQAANPTGVIGNMMTRIWSIYFNDLTKWGYSHVNLSDEDVILDIGFGGGSGIKYMKKRNRKIIIYGIDVSEEAVKTASSLNQEYINIGEVILAVGDVAHLEFVDKYFNLIVAMQTHIYWDELEKGLLECHRVLSEDGVFLILCEIDKIEYHLSEYRNANDFKLLLNEIGFSAVDIKNSNNYIAFICRK